MNNFIRTKIIFPLSDLEERIFKAVVSATGDGSLHAHLKCLDSQLVRLYHHLSDSCRLISAWENRIRLQYLLTGVF
jgi:hypothetical protein